MPAGRTEWNSPRRFTTPTFPCWMTTTVRMTVTIARMTIRPKTMRAIVLAPKATSLLVNDQGRAPDLGDGHGRVRGDRIAVGADRGPALAGEANVTGDVLALDRLHDDAGLPDHPPRA